MKSLTDILTSVPVGKAPTTILQYMCLQRYEETKDMKYLIEHDRLRWWNDYSIRLGEYSTTIYKKGNPQK